MVAAVQLERTPGALREHLLRLPSRRPQKGRQAVRDVLGDEHWAGADGDFLRAVAWTPGVFTWVRDRAHLVELPALWVRMPLGHSDGEELLEGVSSRLLELNCPAPHLVVEGDGHLVVMWAVEPFRRPKKSAPDEHHYAFRKGLEDWTKAALKLSFALEDLGARPLDAATAHELMHSFVPFPLPASSPLRHAVADTLHEPARVLESRPLATPLRVADISRPLSRFDARMFDVLGIQRPRGKTRYLSSPRTLAALEMTAPGERHIAARTIVCACVWDGLDYAATLDTLRGWAAKCAQDGKFPFRRRRGDELELLAQWAVAKLSPGGPDKVKTTAPSRRTKTALVEQTVLGFLASVGGQWTGAKHELGQQAALWGVEAGQPALCPRTTLKRALSGLKASGALQHTVARSGTTWLSTWASVQGTVEIQDLDETGVSWVQSPQSTWAPASAAAQLLHSERGAGGRLPPALGVARGAEIPFGSSLPASISTHDVASPGQRPEIGSSESLVVEGRGRKARPRQRRLRLTAPRQRRRSKAAELLPVITPELLLQLADVAPTLSIKERRVLLEEARAGLRPRPKVLSDFAGAVRKRALRIRRKQLQLNPLPSLALVPNPPPAVAEIVQPVSPFAEFRRMQKAALTPLHGRTVQDRARILLEMGLSAIVLQPRSKEPAQPWLEWQREAMPTALMRRSLSRLSDEAGLAIVCGRVSDVIVADLDDASAVAWAQKHLPETPWKTKTARGEHWFYRHPVEDVEAVEIPWRGQLQGDGRYVVAPGSLHPDGHLYEAVGYWTQPRAALPVYDFRWLRTVEALRAARAKILEQKE